LFAVTTRCVILVLDLRCGQPILCMNYDIVIV